MSNASYFTLARLHKYYRYPYNFIFYSIDASIEHHAMLNLSTIIDIYGKLKKSQATRAALHRK
jgi:hypothetical protein